MNNDKLNHKKALILGAGGFVGRYLATHLHDDLGFEVWATRLPGEELSQVPARVRELDILNKEAIVDLLFETRPDYIFHLAAQSSVSVAWYNPQLTIDTNIKGAVNVLDAVRELFYKPRIVLVGSGEEYGYIEPGETPISEEHKTEPGNIYAATKACQNMMGSIYSKAYDMEIVMVRAFNHVGPRQPSIFVVSDFCRQVAEIEAGKREPVMYVGNLSARRDFTDVRDVVRAYAMLAESGIKGETYNVGRGKAYEIREVLDRIIAMSDKDIKVEIDQAKIRPVDVPVIEADIMKLTNATGWVPRISMEDTLKEVLDYWRQVVADPDNQDGIDRDEAFLKKYGISREDYILNRKFNRAKELLRFTIKSVEEITMESGIEDRDLRRMLMESEGMTPEDYRKKWAQWIKS